MKDLFITGGTLWSRSAFLQGQALLVGGERIVAAVPPGTYMLRAARAIRPIPRPAR